MLKLLVRCMKPFALSVCAVIALLFVQAQTELALPDYMSDIVNTGLQSSGITEGVPMVMRRESYDKYLLFASEEEQALLESSYEVLSQQEASAEQIADYPLLAKSDLYRLKDVEASTYEQLEAWMPQVGLMVMSLDAAQTEPTLPATAQSDALVQLLEQLPEGMNLYEFLALLPASTRLDMRAQVETQLQSMGASTMDTAASTYVKAEYESIGMDTDAMQNEYILLSGLKMLGMSLLSVGCAILVGLLASRIAAGVGKQLRGDVFKKVESFSSAEFNRFSTASLITRNINDIQQVQLVIVMLIRIVIYAPIIGVGALLKVLNSGADMTWIIALVLVVILGLIITIFMVAMPKFKIAQKLVDRLNLVMREFLDGMSVIRAFNTQRHEEEKFDQANRDITKTNLFINRTMGAMMPIMMLVMNSVALLIIWVGGHQIDAGAMQIGDIMAFIQYTMQIIMAFLMISMVAIMLPRAAVSGERVAEVLDCELSIQDPDQPQSFDSAKRGEIEFRHVSFRYPGAQEDVLHDLNFTIQPGATTAFIGSTGSGKSTLINLVPRFYDASEGAVFVDGVDVRKVKQSELRDKIGYVPQKGVLFSGTIASNLRYAKADADETQMRQACDIAQASEFIEAKEDRFDTAIAQGGTNVSGGQKQRLSIARAVIKQPEIYIFDDSFSALDFKTDARLRKELNDLIKETKATVLLVAQRISSIMHAETIVVLDQGKVVGIGTHDELMKQCEVYREIAYSQLTKEELSHE